MKKIILLLTIFLASGKCFAITDNQYNAAIKTLVYENLSLRQQFEILRQAYKRKGESQLAQEAFDRMADDFAHAYFKVPLGNQLSAAQQHEVDNHKKDLVERICGEPLD